MLHVCCEKDFNEISNFDPAQTKMGCMYLPLPGRRVAGALDLKLKMARRYCREHQLVYNWFVVKAAY